MNLLPATEKNNLKKGLKLRLLVLISLIVSGSLLAGIVLLVPAYLVAMGNFSKLNFENDSSSANNLDSSRQFLDLPKEIDVKSKFLQTYNNSVMATDSFAKIVNLLPDGVKIDSINFTRGQSLGDKKGASITVSGLALSRQMLVSFSNSLKDSGQFSNVEIPVSSLTKDKDLPFTIKIFIEQ